MNSKIKDILNKINTPIIGDARVIMVTRLEQVSNLLVALAEEAERQSGLGCL